MLAYPCPSCGQRLVATPDRAGQRTICPKCLRSLVIPTEDQTRHGPDVDPTAPPPVELHGSSIFTGVDTPPPRPAAMAAAAASPPVAARRAVDPKVTFNSPGPVDVAAELSAAISARMKPPPEPPSDLRVSTALWLGLTAAAVGLWAVGVAYHPGLFPFVALIGAVQAAGGYLWAAYLAGERNPGRTAAALAMPWRLARPFGEHRYRPTRFVVTGLALLGLYAIGPAARSAMDPVAVNIETGRSEQPAGGPADRLRAAAELRQPDALLAELADLAKPGAAPAEGRAETVTELKRLTNHGRADVRSAALAALAAWAPNEARGPALAALKSPDAAERKAALALAPRWPDEEVAKAVAARLADRDDQYAAKEALLAIGGPAAEAGLLPQLTGGRAEVRWLVIDLLAKVGGPKASAALAEAAKSDPSPEVREHARRQAQALGAKGEK